MSPRRIRKLRSARQLRSGPTRPRSSEFPAPRKSTTRGVGWYRRIPARSRNRTSARRFSIEPEPDPRRPTEQRSSVDRFRSSDRNFNAGSVPSATGDTARGGDVMFRPVLHNAIVAAGILLGLQAAHAENRIALVIGQSAYRAVTPLPNPAKDGRAMTQLLGDAGFEVVAAAERSQNELREKVGDVAARIAAKGSDTIALVFYAGHGMQIDGENFLVPVDIDPKREADVPLQAVRLNDVLNTLNSVPSKIRIILLDACRNNPFPEINKTAGRGLAIVDAKVGAAGTFVSYSTSPGAGAEDGGGADSPYTTALLKSAREPGLSIEEAFKRVRLSVNQATEGRQTPWDSSSLTNEFSFFGGRGDGARQSAAKRTVDDWRRELQGKQPEVANEMIVADGTGRAY